MIEEAIIMNKKPKKIFRSIGTQTEEELLFSYIIEKRKKYEQMASFFNKITQGPQNSKQISRIKGSLVLDKLSLPNSSMYNMENMKNQPDISVLLKSEEDENFPEIKNNELQCLEEENGESEIESRSKPKTEKKKMKSQELENRMKERKNDVQISDKTRKKLLNRTTTLGVNDRFLKNKKIISISFDHTNANKIKKKSKTPDHNHHPHHNKISAFGEYLKAPVSPIISKKSQNKRKLKMFSVIPKKQEFTDDKSIDETKKLFGVGRRNSDNSKIQKTGQKNARHRKSVFLYRSNGRSATPGIIVTKDDSKNFKKSITCGFKPRDHFTYNFSAPRKTQNGNQTLIMKSDLQANFKPEYQENLKRNFSYGPRKKKEIEHRDVEELFRSDPDDSEMDSSFSSDIKDKKRFIMKDLEKSMIMQEKKNHKKE